MTVVPLFCARFIKAHGASRGRADRDAGRHALGSARASTPRSTPVSNACSIGTTELLDVALARPVLDVVAILGACRRRSLVLYPLLGVAFFPRTDAGPVRDQSQGADGHAASK